MRRPLVRGISMLFLAVGTLAACQAADEQGERGISSRQQAQTAETDARAASVSIGSGAMDHSRSIDTAPTTASPPPVATQQHPHAACPIQKRWRADWPELLTAKQAEKDNEDAELALRPLPEPTPVSGERLRKQQQFINAMAGKWAQINALTPGDREQAYADLKQAMLAPASSQAVAQLNGMATTAGVEHAIAASYIYQMQYSLVPNQAYTIETLNLSPGADTVINVQADDHVSNAFVDGNDDCGTRLSGCTGPRSYLTIAPSTSWRIVYIIVRDYSQGGSVGTATLRITQGTNTPTDYAISFTGGYHKNLSSYPAGTHFLTTEELDGTHDTILLVTVGNAANGVAHDDDNGIQLMSSVHALSACPYNCQVIVASYYSGAEATNLIWDGDADDPSLNCDTDGLSDTLENVIGSDPCKNDTDEDGISDWDEMVGVDYAYTNYNLLRFTMYGANPTVPDLFLEADWAECVPSGPGDASCETQYAQSDPDKWRLSAEDAEQIASHYFGPSVSVHIDNAIGQAPDPSNPNRYVYNFWRGAERRSEAWSGNRCQFLSPERVGYFHGARLRGTGGGETESIRGHVLTLAIWR